MLSRLEYLVLSGAHACLCNRTTLYVILGFLSLAAMHWVVRCIHSQWASSANCVSNCTLYNPGKLYDMLTTFAITPPAGGVDVGSERHRTEALCRSLLETMLQMELPKCRPKWLTNPTTKRALELDMYNKEHQIAFEYDGAQHDVYVPHYHQNEYHFAYRKLLDRLKTEMCRDAGVLLIRINWKDVSVNDELRTAQYLERLLYQNGLAYQSIVNEVR
jgi:hypothetical protein